MQEQYWSWLLGFVGVVGFILAGKKIWWSWYINVACQALWFTYAMVTEQYGFIATALVYTVVFAKNAFSWTLEHYGIKYGKYCGTKIWRLKDWKLYGLYRKHDNLTSFGVFIFWKE